MDSGIERACACAGAEPAERPGVHRDRPTDQRGGLGAGEEGERRVRLGDHQRWQDRCSVEYVRTPPTPHPPQPGAFLTVKLVIPRFLLGRLADADGPPNQAALIETRLKTTNEFSLCSLERRPSDGLTGSPVSTQPST